MADFTAKIKEQVVAACQVGKDEASEALSRALGSSMTLEVGEAGAYSAAVAQEEAGLAILLKVDLEAAVILIPESSGLLPDWYAAPDPTGESKLATLAQELGMLLLPEEFMPLDFKAGKIENIRAGLKKAGCGDASACVSLPLSGENGSGEALLVWPAPQGDAIFKSSAAPQQPTDTPKNDPKLNVEEKPKPAAATPPPPQRTGAADYHQLPNYAKSLLKIAVEVNVTLATKKMRISEITELGIGSIIQFDKSCEESIDLEVGEHRIAQGEAVKIGDKFGMRVTNVLLPEERFISIKGNRRVR
ncbi:FliM/FliN family flagellar motor switch protein [Blastopirellula sp. JC732]|uniref:Flagellar motor switch protein FliN n=1 Tax=Blastopirellula sediminis TaxID=2894196 RepID=A0A9X1MLY5_9BACT|nr:FliM/FliN family flagellar motor switch protein [Blastopirellula sediminis]MCC9607134.1 FliM/FliN family flagellar motor switch protein [Blastopirellula sediminis]MCC9629573.1 FliM/FliN family flagellar motor switch protein [Blastopirellula sediminis]